MQRAGRKNPRLQEKLDALKRELARVETDIQGISRAVETPNPEKAMRQLRRVAKEPLPREAPVAPRAPLPDRLNPVPADSFFDAPPSPPASPQNSLSGFASSPDIQIPKAVPDQRFATYFGSGSLHSVRPLRQERRTQRNRALFMLGMAIFVLYVLYHVIF